MKSTLKRVISFIFIGMLFFILNSCVDLAKENLNGSYHGTLTAVFKFGELNIGMQDKIEIKDCKVRFFADNDNPGLVVLVDKDAPLNIDVKGISLQQNGSAFNIPQQDSKQGDSLCSIVGAAVAEDENGNKVDGILFDNNNLKFSYITTVSTNMNGYTIPLRIEVIYDLVKN